MTFPSRSLTRTIYHARLKQCENLTSSSKFIDQNLTGFKVRCTLQLASLQFYCYSGSFSY